jgi:hypothetical protein
VEFAGALGDFVGMGWNSQRRTEQQKRTKQ